MNRTMPVLLLLLSGVYAHGANEEPPPQSQALRIARAAGFKVIKDIDAETLKSHDPKATAVESPGLYAARGVAVASGAANPAQGMSRGAEVGFLFFTSLLGSLPVAHPENSARMLIWMPKESAASPEAATAALRDLWYRAIAATLPQAQVELRQRETKKGNLAYFVWIDAADCRDCRLFSMAIEQLHPPKIGSAPDFLGSYPAYLWGGVGHTGNGNFAGYPWTAEIAPADRVEFLRRLSGNLPSWIYIYLPLDRKLALYPQILHQGKALYFEEPGLDGPIEDKQVEEKQSAEAQASQ